ncbi:MAG: hypothetical protein ACREOJ_11190, partial [Gemmatimonadaceae bacterium]
LLSKARLPGAEAGMASHAQDPCTLLSASEAEPYVGNLPAQPYRVDHDRGLPAVGGDACMYHGVGRMLLVSFTSGGGAMLGHTLTGVPAAMNTVFGHDSAAAGMTTMVNKIMSHGPAGPWDTATWIPGGSLTLTKGDHAIMIDMSGASGSESDAYALARRIMPRVGHPLDYDGAKAVAQAPIPRAHPVNPCDVISRAEVEAAIGALSASPVAEDSTTCTYKVATANGVQAYPVSYGWENGLQGYNRMKHGMATLRGLIGTPTSTLLDTMKPNAGMAQALGGLMKMMGGAAGQGSAPGAVTKVGFQTDTMLKGPWDSASLLHGTQLLAVRHDVFVAMDLQSADYDKAKALLGAICRRL